MPRDGGTSPPAVIGAIAHSAAAATHCHASRLARDFIEPCGWEGHTTGRMGSRGDEVHVESTRGKKKKVQGEKRFVKRSDNLKKGLSSVLTGPLLRASNGDSGQGSTGRGSSTRVATPSSSSRRTYRTTSEEDQVSTREEDQVQISRTRHPV